jgi:replicative DNA helicase
MVIAAVCVNKDMASANQLGIDDLFVTHQDVWREVKNYYFKHRGLPPLSEVEKKFPGIELEDPQVATAYAIDELRSSYAKRKMAEVVQLTVNDLQTGAPLLALEKMHQRVGELAKLTATARDLDVSDPGSMRDHLLNVKERADQMGGTVGIPTGFKAIDASYFTGMAPGHLIVVIGWPGRGKTWMTGYLAVKAWERGYKPMIVSLEMSPEVMRDRLYTMMGSGMFNMADFSRGQIDLDDFDNWSSDYFENKNGFIVVSSEGQSEVTPSHIQSKIDQHKPDLVIVDYHQLMSDNNRSTSPQEANRNISLQLKRMAVRNAIPIIDVVSATMSNVSDQQAPPLLSQVAWSKAIEYDADHAIAVHRMDEEDSDLGAIELVCRKNRHGTEYDFMVEVDLGRGYIKEVYE